MTGMPTPGGTTTSTRPPGKTRIDNRRARRLMRTFQPGEASAGDHNGICSGSAAALPLRLRIAYSSLRPVVTGSRAARSAGSRPPTRPSASE